MTVRRLMVKSVALLIAGGVLTSPGTALAQSAAEDNSGAYVVLFVIVVVAALIYFIPSLVAFRRRHPNRWPIFAINLLFGGTGLGWLGSLIWAFGAVHKSDYGSDGGESGLNIFANDPVRVTLDEPTSVAPRSDPRARAAAQLTKLKELYDGGAIDEAEYKQMRKRYVSDL